MTLNKVVRPLGAWLAILALATTTFLPAVALAEDAQEDFWSRYAMTRRIAERAKEIRAEAARMEEIACGDTWRGIREKGWTAHLFRSQRGVGLHLLPVNRDTACIAGNFVYGGNVGAVKTVAGTIDSLIHPIRTVKNVLLFVGSLVTRPGETTRAVTGSLILWKDRFVWSVRHDPRQAVRTTGEVAGRVAANIAIAKGTSAALKWGKAKLAYYREIGMTESVAPVTPPGAGTGWTKSAKGSWYRFVDPREVPAGAGAVTDEFGKMRFPNDITPKFLLQAFDHEEFHSLLGARWGPPELRGLMGVHVVPNLYGHSHLWRWFEEAAAEFYSGVPFLDAVRYPLTGYGISVPRAVGEAAVGAGAAAATGYGVHRAATQSSSDSR